MISRHYQIPRNAEYSLSPYENQKGKCLWKYAAHHILFSLALDISFVRIWWIGFIFLNLSLSYYFCVKGLQRNFFFCSNLKKIRKSEKLAVGADLTSKICDDHVLEEASSGNSARPRPSSFTLTAFLIKIVTDVIYSPPLPSKPSVQCFLMCRGSWYRAAWSQSSVGERGHH